jgi:hypothetical protein
MGKKEQNLEMVKTIGIPPKSKKKICAECYISKGLRDEGYIQSVRLTGG